MKIVVAFDKFKGGLGALEAGEIVRRALQEAMPGTEILVKPMADGGDGTAAALQVSLGGEWISTEVTGPLPEMRRRARWLWLAEKHLAVLEMAQASGLAWLSREQLNPLLTSTYGTGELVGEAIRQGAKRIWLTVGGSATVDGGVGAAMALGWRFLDSAGQPVGRGGGELERIARIIRPWPNPEGGTAAGISPAPPGAENSAPGFPEVEVLSDVDNPLCGEHGAARVFGPQKGATSEMAGRLDAGLRHLADLVKEQLGRDILSLPGGGAAGGTAAGAAAFFNARIIPGAEAVMTAIGLAADLAGADWVITGEGRFDGQSLRGKVVSGIASLARKTGTRIAILAGSVELSDAECRRAGIDIARAIRPPAWSIEASMQHAKELLFAAATDLARSGRLAS